MNEDIVRKYSDKQILKLLFTYLKPYLKSFLIAISLLVFTILIYLLPAYFTGLIVEILGSDLTSDEKFNKMIIMMFVFIGLFTVALIFEYISSTKLNKVGQKILYDIRSDVFNHIENLDIAIINKEPIGRLVSRVTNDTASLNEFFTSVLVQMLRNILTIIGVIIIMFTISPILTGYIFIIIPIILLTTILFRKFSKKTYHQVKKEQSKMNAFLSENISGMKIIQVFNQEDKINDDFTNTNTKLKTASQKEILVFSIFQPLNYVLYICGQILVIYIGVKLIGEHKLEAYLFVSFYNYINSLFQPIQNMVDQFNLIQQTFTSTERIMTILDMENEVLNSKNPIEVKEFKGKIEFKNVYFAYNDEDWILKDVSFVINPKETCAFVGATGAGKTTILSLIVRNYDVNSGEIFIDDINIKDIKLSSLRKLVGQMLQDVFMFSGTIKENITLDDPNISDEQIVNACKYVSANTFIEKYHDKYEHKISERGQNFSAGERQLISFARTIAHKPNIMILDEATANIDTETELIIQQSLNKMKNIGTMLIVAHRLSTIQNADKIIVLHKGKVIEQGNHQELLKLKGMYYNLYQIQFAKEGK